MTSRDRRAVLIGAAVVVAAALLLRVVPAAARATSALRERATQRLGALARAREVVRESPAARDSLAAALAGMVALAPKLLEGRSRAEASASLASVVSLLAGRSGLKVLRVAPGADSAGGIVQPVRLQAEFEGDIGGLTRFLAALESGQPLLSARSLGVTAPEAVPRPGAPEALRIEVEVAGWFFSGAGR